MQIGAVLRRLGAPLFAFPALAIAGAVVPALVLAAAVLSLGSLRAEESAAKSDVVIKIIGHSWYWNYEYPGDKGGFTFKSAILPEADREPGRPRRFEVDNDMVVPVNKVVMLRVTSDDVIHSWTVSAFDLKIDAIPGHINEITFKAEREGVYRGQCSTLCGEGHAFMPVVVRVVGEAEYEAWLAEARKKYAVAIPLPFAVADNR